MNDSRPARTPVVCYGINLMAAAVAYWVLQTVIVRSQGPPSVLKQAVGRDAKGKASPVLYLAGIAVTLLAGADRPGIYVGLAFFVAVAVLWLVPDRRIERAIAAKPVRPDNEPRDSDGIIPE